MGGILHKGPLPYVVASSYSKPTWWEGDIVIYCIKNIQVYADIGGITLLLNFDFVTPMASYEYEEDEVLFFAANLKSTWHVDLDIYGLLPVHGSW